jgi:Rieske Fe-S protein
MIMTTCEVCGNSNATMFEIRHNGSAHVFDSFECAIKAMAPTCAHCGCKVIGHGLEAAGQVFCCAHCAQEMNAGDMEQRAPSPNHATWRS